LALVYVCHLAIYSEISPSRYRCRQQIGLTANDLARDVFTRASAGTMMKK
jgi:hypothetical protein